MSTRTIISVALNGARRQKSENPAVPLSAAEIARAAADAADAGAAIAHIHARLDDGTATQDARGYREIINRVAERSDIIVQISIGGLGFSIDELLTPLCIRPEAASFPLRALNEKDPDPLSDLRRMAAQMKEYGVRPELDGKSVPMIDAALALHKERALEEPLCFGLVFNDLKSMDEGAERLLTLTRHLPPASAWWAIKGGEYSMGIAALALSLGGHIRTGFEDTLRDPVTGEMARSNAHLVERLAALSRSLGREPATPAEARKILSMKPPVR